MVLRDPLVDGVAVERGLKTSAEEERSGQLAMERVALIGGRSQAVTEDDGKQSLNLARRVLVAKVKRSISFERLSENERGLVVGIE